MRVNLTVSRVRQLANSSKLRAARPAGYARRSPHQRRHRDAWRAHDRGRRRKRPRATRAATSDVDGRAASSGPWDRDARVVIIARRPARCARPAAHMSRRPAARPAVGGGPLPYRRRGGRGAEHRETRPACTAGGTWNPDRQVWQCGTIAPSRSAWRTGSSRTPGPRGARASDGRCREWAAQASTRRCQPASRCRCGHPPVDAGI